MDLLHFFHTHKKKRIVHVVVLVFLFLLNVFIGLFLIRYGVARFAALGYVGLFITILIVSAIPFFPVPLFPIALGYMFFLNFFVIAFIIAVAAALGGIMPYLFGREGFVIFENKSIVRKVSQWFENKPKYVIVFLSAVIPTPFFDLINILSGVLRLRIVYYCLALFFGKLILYLFIGVSFPYWVDLLRGR